MARSDITTIIPLDRAAAILGINPWHFNQIATGRVPETNACDDVWFQTAYQRIGQGSRDDLAIALRQAEDMVFKYLSYFPLPVWVDSEEQPLEKPFAVELASRSWNSRGQYKSIRANYGYVQEVGRRAKTLLDEAAAIVYSDADGDGYAELATVTLVTSITEAQEIRVYFPAESGMDMWEIRPIDVTITAGVATITFKKYLVPVPNLWTKEPDITDDDPVYRAIDGDDTANFITAVDVYRVYTDTTEQATFYHEGTCGSCSGSGCEACGWSTETACLRIRDSRLGLLSYMPASWDEDDEVWNYSTSCCSEAEKIILHYRAGTINRNMKYPYLQIDPLWERAIVYFAFSKLDRDGNICDNTRNIWNEMRVDLARSQDGVSYAIAGSTLSNPLGTTRAAIDLWRLIEQYRLV